MSLEKKVLLIMIKVLKSFVISVWTFWTSILHGRKNLLEVIKFILWRKIFQKKKKKIKKGSRLRNRFLKDKSLENTMQYRQQRNDCVSLSRKTKLRCYVNLNEKEIIDNKQFWKVVKAFFPDKSKSRDK